MSKPIYNIKEENGLISFDFLEKNSTSVRTALQEEAVKGPWTVYRTDGTKVGVVTTREEADQLPSGVYLLRSGKEVRKVLIH